MNYKLDEYDYLDHHVGREKKNKYSKKVNHKRNQETYSRKGKNKFSARDLDY